MAFFKCSFSWGHASQWTGFLFLVLGTQKFSFLSWFTKFRKKIFIYNTWVFRKQTVSTNVPMDTAFPGCFDHLRVFFQPRSVLEKKRGNVQLGTSIYDLSWIFGQLMLNAEESFFMWLGGGFSSSLKVVLTTWAIESWDERTREAEVLY